MGFYKCYCSQCGQHIEFPSEGEGMIVPCPSCQTNITLTREVPSPEFYPVIIPPVPVQGKAKPKPSKPRKSNLTKFTEETIRSRTASGDTPLHRAAKNGQFDQIPAHLLTAELFLATNDSGETPLHVAAKQGTLSQVPLEFLTPETMTVRKVGAWAPDGRYQTGSGYWAMSDTPLHVACQYGHAQQIPAQFFTPEFLSLEASGYRRTVLHMLAECGALHLVSKDYSRNDMWNIPDFNGMTAMDVARSKVENEEYRRKWGNEPASEKQQSKLQWFGCTWEGRLTKAQASKAIDECIRRFPELEREYYGRPATEEQWATIRSLVRQLRAKLSDYVESGEELTYGEAKDLIRDLQSEAEQKEIEQIEKQVRREDW